MDSTAVHKMAALKRSRAPLGRVGVLIAFIELYLFRFSSALVASYPAPESQYEASLARGSAPAEHCKGQGHFAA